MTKKIITFLLLFSSVFYIYSQENSETDEKPVKKNYYLLDYPESINNYTCHTISMDFIFPFGEEFQADYLAGNLNYNFENLYTNAQTGFQTAKTNFKFYAADTFWFLNRTLYSSESETEFITTRLGSRFFYNFIHYNDLVTYNNLLLGLDGEFNFKNNLQLKTQFLFDITLGNIDLGNSDSIFIHWWDFALKISLYYQLPVKPDLQIYFDMSNFDSYTIQRFYAPIITTGITYTSPYHFFAGAEFNLHYTDLFSFSRYLEYGAFTIKGGYLF